MHNPAEKAAELNSHARLLRNLAGAMHDIAQPIAILQCMLELATLKSDGMAADSYKVTVQESLEELGEIVNLLSYLHELIRIARKQEARVPVQVASILSAVVEDLAALANESGVTLDLHCPSSLPEISGYEPRIRHAMFYAVQAALSVAQPPDVISLEVAFAGQFVTVSVFVRGTGSESKKPSAAVQRSLNLVQAIVESEYGEFCETFHPFILQMALPVMHVERALGAVSSAPMRLN